MTAMVAPPGHSQVMAFPGAASPSTLLSLVFSAPLETVSANQITLLRGVHRTPENALYKDGPVLRGAVRRYTDVFFPLLSDLGQSEICPPLDVAYIWHCHRLAPLQYAADCEAIHGRLISPKKGTNPFAFCEWTGDKPGRSELEILWRTKYPEEPFHRVVPSSCEKAREAENCAETLKLPECVNKLSVDLASIAERQSDFLWQVMPPQYQDPAFLSEAVERYFKLLVLMREHPGAFLVPAMDMDLIWHTHLAFPDAYAADCKRIVGTVVTHDDSVNDREEGSKLDTSTKSTQDLWQERFGESWAKPGCMYRGKTPESFMNQWATARPVTEGAGAAGYPPPQYGPPPPQYAQPYGAPPQYGPPPPGYGAPQYYPPPQAPGPQYPQPGMQPMPMQPQPMQMQPRPVQQTVVYEESCCPCCCPPKPVQTVGYAQQPMGYGNRPMMVQQQGPMMGGASCGGGGGGMSTGMALAGGLVGGMIIGEMLDGASCGGGGCGGGGGGCGGGGGW